MMNFKRKRIQCRRWQIY